MKRLIPFPIVFVLYLMLSNGLFSNVVREETLIKPLQREEDNVYTTELFHVPLFIKDVRVDVSIKANTYLWIWCELKIGKQVLTFTLNDLSIGYHVEQDRVQVDGKISEQAISFKANINTDGIIEEVPKLVLTFYTLR